MFVGKKYDNSMIVFQAINEIDYNYPIISQKVIYLQCIIFFVHQNSMSFHVITYIYM